MTMSSFIDKYMLRMKLNPTSHIQNEPLGYDFLCQVTEAHLKEIPFENLAQHGGKGGPVVLNLHDIAEKVLDRKRGGFCLELNGLLGMFLHELEEFFEVTIVPAIVYTADQGGFDRPPSHIFLIVTTKCNGSKFFVDVGFGEPPLHPLEYILDKEQVTPEGMKSRIVRYHNNHDDVVLEWYKDNQWQPRLKWNYDESISSPNHSPMNHLPNFVGIRDLVYREDANFSKKLIVCTVTRDRKHTLSGNVLKLTGPPRFLENVSTTGSNNNKVVLEELESIEYMRHILLDMFGIPLEETEGLQFGKLTTQDPNVFSHF